MMKFRVTMKTPDVLESVIDADMPAGVDTLELRNLCKKWFKYGELLTVEIDVEAETCTVLPA